MHIVIGLIVVVILGLIVWANLTNHIGGMFSFWLCFNPNAPVVVVTPPPVSQQYVAPAPPAPAYVPTYVPTAAPATATPCVTGSGTAHVVIDNPNGRIVHVQIE